MMMMGSHHPFDARALMAMGYALGTWLAEHLDLITGVAGAVAAISGAVVGVLGVGLQVIKLRAAYREAREYRTRHRPRYRR